MVFPVSVHLGDQVVGLHSKQCPTEEGHKSSQSSEKLQPCCRQDEGKQLYLHFSLQSRSIRNGRKTPCLHHHLLESLSFQQLSRQSLVVVPTDVCVSSSHYVFLVFTDIFTITQSKPLSWGPSLLQHVLQEPYYYYD